MTKTDKKRESIWYNKFQPKNSRIERNSLKKSITEEMKYRRKLWEYALKNGVTKAARKYHTYRQFVYRQLEKYDGTVRSLALKSRRPKNSPSAHTETELDLIKRMLKRNGNYGLAEVYIKGQRQGYSRSFESMCRQIRQKGVQEGSEAQEELYKLSAKGRHISGR